MKTFLFLAFSFLMVPFASIPVLAQEKTIFLSPKSELRIIGSSNVNTFKCVFNVENLKKPLEIAYRKGDDVVFFQRATLVLKNSFFDCGGTGINKDFHELLRTKKHPEILLTLKEINRDATGENKLKAVVEIQIAGVSRSYSVMVQADHRDRLHVNGGLKLDITDFNLEAPKKMMGLIVVSEKIEIVFNLFFANSEHDLTFD